MNPKNKNWTHPDILECQQAIDRAWKLHDSYANKRCFEQANLIFTYINRKHDVLNAIDKADTAWWNYINSLNGGEIDSTGKDEESTQARESQ